MVSKSSESDEQFIDLLLKIFENKIFPIYKINFMQYLPLYVIGLTNESEVASIKCKVFAEKLISFLILKAFNVQQQEHLNIRQYAWNYLASLVSRENGIIRPQIIIKSLQFVLNYYEKTYSNKKGEKKFRGQSNLDSQFSQTEASETDTQG